MEYPESFLLEKVPQEGERFAGSRCPATFQMGNELSFYLEYAGESYGFEDMGGWRCDAAYTLAEVLTGYAYRSGCVAETSEDDLRMLRAFGFQCRRYFSSPSRGRYLTYEQMKEKILHTLVREGRPVIVKGLAPMFFGGVVVGYEQSGDVLIGWSYGAFDFAPGAEPTTGRCEKWYRADTALYILERESTPSHKELYLEGLEQAYRFSVLENDQLIGELGEWIRFLRMDRAACVEEVKRTLRVPGSWEVFTFDNLTDETIEGALLSMADPLWCDYAERRYYAANFIRQAGAHFPAHKDEMKAIADLYGAIDRHMHEYDQLCGHEHASDTVDGTVFWNPEVRAQLAQRVEFCRARELEIAARMKALLEEMGITG